MDAGTVDTDVALDLSANRLRRVAPLELCDSAHLHKSHAGGRRARLDESPTCYAGSLTSRPGVAAHDVIRCIRQPRASVLPVARLA